MSNKPIIVKFTGPNPSIEVIPIGHFTDNLVNDVTFEFNRYIGDIDLAQFYCMLHIENLGATLLQTKVSDSKLQAVLTVTTDITSFPGAHTSSIKFVRDTGNLQYVWTTRNFDLIVERRVDLDTEIQHIDPTPLAGFIINLAANTERINTQQEQIDTINGTLSEHDSRINELEGVVADKADLVDGKVPREQMDDYFDDIIEGFYINNQFYSEGEENEDYLITPELGKLYVDADTNVLYRWIGSQYEKVTSTFELTKAKVEAVLTGDITSHNHTTEIGNHNASELAHPFLQGKIDEARAIAEGKVSAMSFETKEDLDDWLEIPGNVETLLVGTNFYIEDLASPDYWWNGTTLVELSTEKIDLTEYAKKTELLTLGTTSNDAYRGDLGDIAYQHSQAPHAPANAQKNVQVNWTEDDADSDAFILNKPTDIILEVSSNDYSSLTPEEKTEIKNIILSLIDETTGNIDNLKYDDIILSNGNVRNHYTSIHESELIVSIIFFMTLQDDEIYHNYRIEISIPKGAGTTTLEKTKIITSQDITKTEIEEKLTGEISSHSHALPTHNHTISEITDLPTIPTIPDITVNNGNAESGKYISQVAVDETDKHKLIVTKADLPTGFSGSYNDLTDTPTIPTNTSDLTNDSGFLTALPTHNHDSDYYKKSETYTKAQTDALVGNLQGQTQELKSITTQPSGTFEIDDLYYNSTTKGMYYWNGSAWELTGAGEPLAGVIYSFNGVLYFWDESTRNLIQIGGGVDLSNYYAKTEVDNAINSAILGLLGGES